MASLPGIATVPGIADVQGIATVPGLASVPGIVSVPGITSVPGKASVLGIQVNFIVARPRYLSGGQNRAPRTGNASLPPRDISTSLYVTESPLAGRT